MQKVVETSDFRKCLEEVSGRSLVRFFEQWFYSPSFPQVPVSSLPSSFGSLCIRILLLRAKDQLKKPIYASFRLPS